MASPCFSLTPLPPPTGGKITKSITCSAIPLLFTYLKGGGESESVHRGHGACGGQKITSRSQFPPLKRGVLSLYCSAVLAGPEASFSVCLPSLLRGPELTDTRACLLHGSKDQSQWSGCITRPLTLSAISPALEFLFYLNIPMVTF